MKDALLDRLYVVGRAKPPSAWTILTLWREKFDTYDIAKQLGVPEHEVANRLIHLREKSGVSHG
jgi:hypothetical protein